MARSILALLWVLCTSSKAREAWAALEHGLWLVNRFLSGQLEEVLEVQAALIPPSTLAYNFTPLLAAAQSVGEDNDKGLSPAVTMWLDQVFQASSGLFAVESGAADGEVTSHTLVFELLRQWKCLLIEPNPFFLRRLLALNRKCYVLHAGLATQKEMRSAEFLLQGWWTRQADLPDETADQAFREPPGVVWHPDDPAFNGSTVNVRMHPLHIVARALGRQVVDYWVLDTEGSEAAILQQTDFGQVEVGLVKVEVMNDETRRMTVKSLMEASGFKQVLWDGHNEYYALPGYFQRRGWPFPRTPERPEDVADSA